MQKLQEKRNVTGATEYDRSWEDVVRESCCGDVVLGSAFSKADVKLIPGWPHIQGEAIQTIDWTRRHWCTAPTSWHHMSPAQIDLMWQFEAEWVENNVRFSFLNLGYFC